MTGRIFRSICLVALAVFLASVVLIMGVMYEYFSGVQTNQLSTQTSLAAQGVEGEGLHYLEGLKPENFRITWIGSDGGVLYDSSASTENMENHLEREEVREALESGEGHSTRYSSTLMERMLYSAKRLSDGSVIRLSSAQNTILILLLGMAQPICIVFAVAVVLSLILASRLSKKIVKPLNGLNLDKPLENDGYDELYPLLHRIDTQQSQLKHQSSELDRRRNELEAIIGSMTEGLILFNKRGTIISINNAAARYLDTDVQITGDSFLTVRTSEEIQSAIAGALAGKRTGRIIELPEGLCHIDAGPVISDDSVTGAALLIYDVSEKEKSEQIRREFTANVSHELKTPLHSISGYAELIRNGMVKEGDIGPFAGKIYSEAHRMINLIDDIINLSHLDEGAEDMRREPTDLLSVSENAVNTLSDSAEKAGISLVLDGDHSVIDGVPQLIYGIVYNLADNAIKYNRRGGFVKIKIADNRDCAVLTVTDNGIGIPEQHRNRIFERFYRVDKSHSKEVGGTGLGLSIVKHGASVHGATVTLLSETGKGTEFTVRFPKTLSGQSLTSSKQN